MQEEQEELKPFIVVDTEEIAEDGHSFFQGYTLEMIDPKEISTDEELGLMSLYYIVRSSDEFKSLDGKPQVLNDGVENREKNLVTRMSHDMQVSQNAMKIAAKLARRQKAEKPTKEIMLAQIMGLGHDLGHTPFGHDGEMAFAKWLKDFNIRFTHEVYGARVFENILNKFLERRHEIREEIGLTDSVDPYQRVFIESMPNIIRGIANHSMYYSGRIFRETIPQKATRLADSISYTVSDLSDLLRGNVQGVDRQRLRDEYRKLGFTLPDDKDGEKFEEVIDLLEQGGDSLRILHERLIDEVTAPERVDDGATVVDDYKMLSGLDDVYPPRGLLQSRASYQDQVFRDLFEREDAEDVFETIIEYYLYMKDMEKDEHGADTNYPYYNREFVRLFEEKIVADKNKYYKAIDYDTEVSCEELAEFISDMDVQKSLQGMMKKIEQSESKQTPLLMTLFAIQNKIQYNEILKNHPEQLNNNTKENQAKVTKMLEDVLMYAALAYYMPEKYCEREEKEEGEEGCKFDKMHLPGIPFKKVSLNGQGSSWPLKYTLYRVQQMQNKDFASPEIMEERLEEIRAELGIREDMLEEIGKLDQDYAHNLVRKALYIKSLFDLSDDKKIKPHMVFRPADIKKMARLRTDVFNNMSLPKYKEWISKIEGIRVSDFILRVTPLEKKKAQRPRTRKDAKSNSSYEPIKKEELSEDEDIMPKKEDKDAPNDNGKKSEGEDRE